MNWYYSRVGATLGLGMSYVAQKQVTRARSVLKRVGKSNWQLEEADHLEKSWLLLAELYLQSGKQEMSLELLHRVIQHNQSSAKAYELIALISEKEQKYCKRFHQYKVNHRVFH
jgi:tetratricopeptide repeat protein 21B